MRPNFSRGSAFRKFFEGLRAGDPVALGLLGVVVFLLAVAGIIWLIDRRRQAREESRGKKSRKARKR